MGVGKTRYIARFPCDRMSLLGFLKTFCTGATFPRKEWKIGVPPIVRLSDSDVPAMRITIVVYFFVQILYLSTLYSVCDSVINTVQIGML